jgi:hypothetical protein
VELLGALVLLPISELVAGSSRSLLSFLLQGATVTAFWSPPPRPRHFEVFIKQQRFLVEEDETWLHVSERIADECGMTRWSVFKLEPVDGEVTSLGRSSSDDDAFTFDWLPGRQCWCYDEHDPSVDQRLAQGMQIKLIGSLGEEPMAIYRGWNMIEIAEHFRKLYNVPVWQRIVTQQVSEEEYRWGVEDGPTQAQGEMIHYTILIGPDRLH